MYPATWTHLKIPHIAPWGRETMHESLRNTWVPKRVVMDMFSLFSSWVVVQLAF